MQRQARATLGVNTASQSMTITRTLVSVPIGSAHERRRRAPYAPKVTCGLSARRSSWPMQHRIAEVQQRAVDLLSSLTSTARTSPPARTIGAVVKVILREADLVWAQFLSLYAHFVSEETKRKWKWSRQMDQETRFWRKILIFCWAVALTVVWEALVPVSVVWGILLPLVLQNVMYDRPLMNPITVALLLILPYKFCAGCAWRWI